MRNFTALLSGSVCCFVGQEMNDKRLRWSCGDDVPVYCISAGASWIFMKLQAQDH